MAHAHGGYWDPNSVGDYTHTPPAVPHQAHGGAYTPGSSVVSYQNQPYPHPHQQQVSPSTSPLSAQSTSYITSPISQHQTQTTMQYQQQPMAHYGQGQQGVIYQQQGSSSGQQDGPMQNKVASVPVTTTRRLTTTNSNQDEKERAEKEFPVTLKGSKHFFESRSIYRWRNPVLYQKPGYNFTNNEVKIRHRDYAGRVSFKPRSDRYLHHNDGYLRNMYVACVDDIYEGPGTSTWKRTYVRKVAPMKVRIATWIIDFSYDPQSWGDWGIMVLRTLPAAIAMALVFWDGKPTVIHRSLCYAPVLYRYHGDAKVWSNLLENRKGLSLMARNNAVYRMLRPRYLCFLREAFNDENRGVDVRSVEEWENSDGQDVNLSYLFVAYSTEHFSHSSQEDMMALHHIAETACRAAKLPAYWIACSCMRDEKELESDVYRISDVLRGSDRMVIAVGRGKHSQPGSSGKANTESLLREWGSRMWTFPEVLLSPGRTISVYTRDGNLQSPLVVAKNQFAAQVWTYMEPDVARHLIDHYLGSISLSHLEQAVLALKCLYSRRTTEYLPGDQAYALMGLLRLRPQIDRTDTAFQAFSRLSLANDSDGLLERYICTLPLTKEQPWYDMTDAYESSLWDITPYCQVAGIADNDTIIIDGAWGISIRWKTFYPVYWSTGPSWKRWFSAIAVEWNGAFFIAAIALIASGASANTSTTVSDGFTTTTYTSNAGTAMIIPGVMFLLLFLYIWLITPNLVRVIYGGKFADTQAEMFGFEGHLNAPTIERAIFGGNFGRFSWTTNGSPLSRSVVNEFGERVGIDPCKDPEIRMKVETAKQARPGDVRIFTLVDTYNMELTLFEAVRPPVTLMFCATEGGMQRAIGCSYEWETQTMFRETVLRMPTTALNRMDRVPRFRMGIQRPVYPSAPITGAV
ncbi:uncharacterized protein FIESC28_02529 [Fusarium coffeatum]|uniref:Heterokaryon incompatibility domain-containing protein n=1 Tax=Fusarium coffeatum TaxID=231269 RepID=A0A366S7D4_9HYPO|nr:uncharacterized protein FIESC28_02529 [Fusarium coffeatum]RBR24596.1 hypothetical protein FIESC28_02529 [Fusarium coffeatum]